jgi:excisionase family DNA binding protein
MTNAHSNHHEPRTRSRQGTDLTWRPGVETAPTGPASGGSGDPRDDPTPLLGGERLALTVTEAAAVLGISRALAYELVARNELPSIRLGRRLVVPKVALLEMLGLRPDREV